MARQDLIDGDEAWLWISRFILRTGDLPFQVLLKYKTIHFCADEVAVKCRVTRFATSSSFTPSMLSRVMLATHEHNASQSLERTAKQIDSCATLGAICIP